jgi:hypothetical protein
MTVHAGMIEGNPSNVDGLALIVRKTIVGLL